MHLQSNLERREGPHSESSKTSPRNLQNALFGKQQKAARSSHELDKSLLSRLQSSKVEHEGLPFWKIPRNHGEGKQHIHYMKNEVKEKEFLAYVIVSKQSNSGVSEHERLVLVDSFSKEIRYYSKIPSFPLILSQLPQQPKETLKMSLAKKFLIGVSKNSIGEVDIKWIQSGEQKKWIFRLANSNLAREFATLVERVRLNQHLRQDVPLSIRVTENPVNPKTTNFIDDIRRLQEKSKSKQLSNSHFSKNNESAQIDNTLNITAAIQEAISQQSPVRRSENNENHKKEEQMQSLKENAHEIIPTSSKEEPHQDPEAIKEPNPNSDSIKSIKMQAILKEVYRMATHQVSQQNNKQTISEVPKQIVPTNSRLSNSSISNQTFNESKSKRQRIFESKQSPKPQQVDTPLALSKILVTKFDSSNSRPSRPLNEGSSSKKKIFQTPNKQYYRTQQPQILDKFRENLLEQRRLTQPAEASLNTSKRSSYIVNLHSQPRREKSNSKSREKSVGQFQTLQKQWLLKWVNTSNMEEKAELYSQFVESCKKRVEKLAESFLNWHLFHKQVSEYVIKQNNVEYKYFMLSKEGNDNTDVLAQEEEMLNKMEDLNELWVMINHLPQTVAKIIIPLACIVIYKGLKVFCKAQLFSNSLIISELKERNYFKGEIQAVKAHFKGCLTYASFFLISSNTNKWLYISDIETSSSLSSRGTCSLSYAFIHDCFSIFNSFSIEKAEQHLRKQSIISYLQQLNTTTLLSSFDFARMLKKHLLNPTLLPLIYQIGEENKFWKARQWMISQLCSIFLEKEARCLMHAFLLKKKINKSVEEQIYFIISKLLRWENEGSSIIAQVSRFLGVNLIFKLGDIIIDEYVISSLLNRLRINCKLLLPENIVRVDQRDPLFWRNIQFQADFMQISFTIATKGLQHSLFSNNYRKINQYLCFEEILTSPSEYSHFYSLMGEKRVHLKQSKLYKLLPWQKQAKIEQYERIFAGEVVNSTSQYYGLEELKLNVAHLIKSKKNYHGKKNYQRWENAILLEIIRANIWARQASSEIMLMHTLLNEQYYSCREETKCIEESLSLLKLSLAYKEEGLISIEQLLEITIATANIHMTFGRLQNAFNFFKVSQSILDEILKNTRKIGTFLVPFFSCYCKCADILLEEGRYQQCLAEISQVRKVCDSWKQSIAMKLQEYEPIKQVTFHICTVMFRTYEILCKRMELLQLVEDSSRQFIQNYFVIQAENNLAFDHSYINLQTAVQIVKQIWKATILNLTPKNVSYQYYFSKTYSLLKIIDASVVRGIVNAIQSQAQQSDAYSQEQSLRLLCTLIYNKTPKSMLQKLSSKSPESILVEECISCLAHLSSQRFLQPQNQQQQSRNRQALKFLSILLSLMGFSFTIACLQQHLQEEEH